MTFRHSQLVSLIRKGSLEEVKAYVQRHPQSVIAKDKTTGRIALHYAVEEYHKGDDDEKLAKLSFLLLANIKGVTAKDKKGRLPLHVFAAEQRTFRPAMLRLLLTLYGGATDVRDVDGSFPLHLAIASRKFDMATVLLEKHVGTLACTATHSFDPLLHMALLYGAPHDFLRLLVDRVPECARMKNTAGDLPLSTALRMQVRYQGLQIVLEAYPYALHVTRQKNGELPLHYEARHGWRHQVLRLLIDRYEEGLSIADGSGRLPLGCAVENNRVSTASLNYMYEKYPQGLTMASWSGTTPLGIACRFDYRYETVAWILEKCPALVRHTVDKHGNLPMHVAAAANSSASFDILRLLMELDPASLLNGNYDGSLPLHSALSTTDQKAVELSLDKVHSMLRRCPEAASRPDHCGQLPLHVACRFGQRVDVVDLLIQCYPEALSKYDKHGYLPFHHACLFADDEQLSLLRYLITKLEGPSLPLTRDGLPPLLFACEQNAAPNVVHFLVHHSLELFRGHCA